MQVIAGAFYQIHFREITTVELMGCVEHIKMAATDIIQGPDTAVACDTGANGLFVLPEGTRKEGGPWVY